MRRGEGGSKGRTYVYTWGWFTMLYSGNQHNIVQQLFSKWKIFLIFLHYATRIFYASGFFFSEIVMIIFLSFIFILSTIIHEIVLFLHHFIWGNIQECIKFKWNNSRSLYRPRNSCLSCLLHTQVVFSLDKDYKHLIFNTVRWYDEDTFF